MKICSVEGCEKSTRARGWCQAHYRRWSKYGDPTASARRVIINDGPCAVEGCERPAKTRGWCIAHYGRWQAYGDPEAGGPLKETKKIIKRELCAWPEGCKNLERARGFCATHYHRVRYNADLEYLLPENARAQRCIVTDCENPQCIKGFCHLHDERRRRGDDPLAQTDVRPIDYETFGGRLFALRASRGWSLKDAGERVGVTRERIRQLEKRATPPQPQVIGKLAGVFGVDASALIGDQLPLRTGKDTTTQKPKILRHIHLECLWCRGVGELPLATISSSHTSFTTMCAYCKGSGAIYISPAPSLLGVTANGEGTPQYAGEQTT